MPCYDLTHPGCNNIGLQPCCYCIITTENIETYGYLKEININKE